MARRFSSIPWGACVVGALATAGVWVRSHYVADAVSWQVHAPRPAASAAAAGSNAGAASLFELLKDPEVNHRRSVHTVPGRLVVDQRPFYEIFV